MLKNPIEPQMSANGRGSEQRELFVFNRLLSALSASIRGPLGFGVFSAMLKRKCHVALAISSPAFQRLKTKSPAGGKDRQRHNVLIADVFRVDPARDSDIRRPFDDGAAVGKHSHLVIGGGEAQREFVAPDLPQPFEPRGKLRQV
jgi:hypothetical protein